MRGAFLGITFLAVIVCAYAGIVKEKDVLTKDGQNVPEQKKPAVDDVRQEEVEKPAADVVPKEGEEKPAADVVPKEEEKKPAADGEPQNGEEEDDDEDEDNDEDEAEYDGEDITQEDASVADARYFYHPYGKFHLRFHTGKSSWHAAESDCRWWGGHLVTIRNHAQNQYIVNQLKSRHMKSAWIGLNDLVHEGSFKWISGSRNGFSNFHSGEPNGRRRENCVEIIPKGKYLRWGGWFGKWNDHSCHTRMPFVCEKKTYRG